MMVGFAIADGKIGSIEDSVAKYLPEWSDSEHSQIRLQHLLQMSSGIESMQYGDNPFSRHQRRQIGTDLERTALQLRRPGTAGPALRLQRHQPDAARDDHRAHDGTPLCRVPLREALETARQSHRARLARSRRRARVRGDVAVCDAARLAARRDHDARRGPRGWTRGAAGGLVPADDHAVADEPRLRQHDVAGLQHVGRGFVAEQRSRSLQHGRPEKATSSSRAAT